MPPSGMDVDSPPDMSDTPPALQSYVGKVVEATNEFAPDKERSQVLYWTAVAVAGLPPEDLQSLIWSLVTKVWASDSESSRWHTAGGRDAVGTTAFLRVPFAREAQSLEDHADVVVEYNSMQKNRFSRADAEKFFIRIGGSEENGIALVTRMQAFINPSAVEHGALLAGIPTLKSLTLTVPELYTFAKMTGMNESAIGEGNAFFSAVKGVTLFPSFAKRSQYRIDAVRDRYLQGSRHDFRRVVARARLVGHPEGSRHGDSCY
jgi:hypothetical protein